jgi:LmbE family N-acetylglucosaminyl deacetylase
VKNWGPGTPEAEWQESLADVPQWTAPRGTLVVVAPHPDDETLGAGGLIYSCARRRHAVLIVVLTDGECSPDDLAKPGPRSREAQGASRILGEDQVRVLRLGFPGGQLKQHMGEMIDALAGLVTHNSTLLAPFAEDGHPDHEAAAQACARVAHKHSLTLLQYPLWAWHHRRPQHLDLSRACRFELSARAQRAKLRALACFKSQIEPGAGGACIPKQVLKYFARSFEVFVA